MCMCMCMNERMSIFSICLSFCLFVCLLNRKLIKKKEHANDFEVCTAACIIKHNGGSAGKKHEFHNNKKEMRKMYLYYIFNRDRN